MAHKIEYLRDSFRALSLDSALWETSGPGLTYFNGGIRLDPADVATTLTSAHSYKLTQSEVTAHLDLLGSGETRVLSMTCRIDASNEVSIICQNDTITFRVRVAGVNSDVSVPVDRDTMTYWRIEERSGLVYFYASDSYTGRMQQRVATHGLDLSSVTLEFSCYLSLPEAADVEYGDGEYGDGFYGGISGLAPDTAYLYSVNKPDPVQSTVPAVVVADRPANWRWAIGPWKDNAPSHELLYAGNRSLQLHLLTPSEAQFITWGESDEAVFMEEGISDLWVTRGADTLFRGRLVRTTDDIDSVSYALNCSAIDYRGILDRRNLEADVTLTAEEQADAVRDFVETAQTATGGYHGITFADPWPTTGVTRTAEFKTGQSVYSCLSKLGAMENGFDLEIDENRMMILHYPQRGEDNGEVLDLGGIVKRVSRTLNMDSYGNAVRQSGADDVTASTQFSGNISNTPEGRWDLQFGDIDLKTNDMVTKTAAAKVQKASQLLPTYRLTLNTGAWRGPSHVWLGDYVYVVVKAGRLRDVIKMRVYDLDIEVDINNHETVSVTVGDPKLTVASMLHHINRNIRALQRT